MQIKPTALLQKVVSTYYPKGSPVIHLESFGENELAVHSLAFGLFSTE